MKIEIKNGLRYLTPDVGLWLTHNNNDEANRAYTDEAILGVNDSPDNWREVTEQEKIEWEAAERARMEAEQAEYEAEMLKE